jgi:hypothetical protein
MAEYTKAPWRLRIGPHRAFRARFLAGSRCQRPQRGEIAPKTSWKSPTPDFWNEFGAFRRFAVAVGDFWHETRLRNPAAKPAASVAAIAATSPGPFRRPSPSVLPRSDDCVLATEVLAGARYPRRDLARLTRVG